MAGIRFCPTTEPSPAPVTPWQGVQNWPNSSSPRARSASVPAIGLDIIVSAAIRS